MPTTRPRRIVRRAVKVMAVLVLLPVAYVSSVLSILYAIEAGWVPRVVRPIAEAYATPLIFYVDHDWPGQKLLFTLMVTSMEAGHESSQD
jgi:hypothetical protein